MSQHNGAVARDAGIRPGHCRADTPIVNLNNQFFSKGFSLIQQPFAVMIVQVTIYLKK